jgi:hypothetical protein
VRLLEATARSTSCRGLLLMLLIQDGFAPSVSD